jgi:hypothetical protein
LFWLAGNLVEDDEDDEKMVSTLPHKTCAIPGSVHMPPREESIGSPYDNKQLKRRKMVAMFGARTPEISVPRLGARGQA